MNSYGMVGAASSCGKVPTGGNPPLATATIAIDTDVKLLSLRFGNDTTAAADWIADLFAAMNVMYQRDLGVALTPAQAGDALAQHLQRQLEQA